MFRKLCPKNVRKMCEKYRLTCGCSLHENVRKALAALDAMFKVVHHPRHGGPCPADAPCRRRQAMPTSVHGIFDQALCPPQAGQATHDPHCVEGRCPKCHGGLGSNLAKTWCAKELNASKDAPKVCALGVSQKLAYGGLQGVVNAHTTGLAPQRAK